jgi:hypothetical protein
MESSANKTDKPDLSPPYAPFRTLRTLIERMESEGDVPARVDRSYLSNIPWSSQNELFQACRSLGLIDAQDEPTALLKGLVEKPNERKEQFRQILQTRYPAQLALGKNATQDQLTDVFKAAGTQGSTLTKAVRFFLQAAAYAEIEVSRLYKTPKAESSPRKAGKRSRKDTVTDKGEPEARKTPPPPSDQAPDLIRNLLKQLPPEGAKWERAKAKVWLTIAENTFDLVYRMEDDKPKSRAVAKPAPDPSGGGDSD